MQVRDKWLWMFVLKMMKEKDYQLIEAPKFQQKIERANHSKMNEDQKQFPNAIENVEQNTSDPTALPSAYLLRNEGRSFFMVRIQAVDSVWNATLSKDIRSIADQAQQLKKRLRAKELSILNLYVFPFQRDEYLLEPIQNHRVLQEGDRTTVVSDAVFVDSEAGNIGWGLAENKLDIFGVQGQQELEIELNKLEWISIDEIKTEIKSEQKKKEKEFSAVFNYGKPVFTYLFLFVNALVFAWLEWQGSSTDPETLIRFGAKWNPAILEGEYWRLITPMFIHIGLIHLLMNSLALYYLGNLVEKIYGSKRFVGMYLFAGFLGALASFIFSPNISAGASGAIFGCFGALLYFGLQHRNLFYRTLGNDVIIVLGINLMIGFVFPMVDNYGHLGGLFGGFLAAMVFNLPSKQRLKDRILGLALIAVVVLGGLFYGFTFAEEQPETLAIQAALELEQENFAAAKDLLERAVELGENRPELLLQLGALYNQLNQFAEAEAILKQVQHQHFDVAELYFQLAYAQLRQNNMEAGEQNLRETIYRNPDVAEAYYNLALVYAEQENYQEALDVLDKAKARGLELESIDELIGQIEELYQKLQELD